MIQISEKKVLQLRESKKNKFQHDESEEIRLQRMGLSKLGEADDFIDHEEEWDEKKKLYDFLMASEIMATKPKTIPFEVAENPGDKDYIPCHLPIPILIISATIKNRLSLRTTKTLANEYIWAMEEAAEWCKEYITFDEIKAKNQMSALKIASDPETYAGSEYSEHIPLHVINAEEKYKKKFTTKTSETTLILK